jgi:Ca2+-binding RTX toxin-like protein
VALLIPASVMLGFTQANSVPATKAADRSQAATANTIKPTPECAAITLTTKLQGSGNFNGTAAAELITGSAGVDTINGLGGDDCILGGGGNDSLTGGAGTDVCIGGPGTDTFAANCETQIQ